MMRVGVLRALIAALALYSAAAAAIRVSDDAGRVLVLEQPARRIVSLAPHITELLFAAGAGGFVVGAVRYSDYPREALGIARVGDSAQLDLERIVGLKPDLIVVWQHGNAQAQLQRLLRLGIPMFYNEPHRLADIARALEQLGQLAGTEAIARAAAREFAAREAGLRARYAGRTPVTVFYQVWEQPLMTINGEHLVSDVIRLCGGRNIFSGLKTLVPAVSIEDVLALDPEAIIADSPERGWAKWPRLKAVARDNLYVIPPDLITRPTPRILEGARQMCEHIESARAKRPGQRTK